MYTQLNESFAYNGITSGRLNIVCTFSFIYIQPENRTYDILSMYFILYASSVSILICNSFGVCLQHWVWLFDRIKNKFSVFFCSVFGVCLFAWYNLSQIILSVSHYSMFQLLSRLYTVDVVTLPRRVVRIYYPIGKMYYSLNWILNSISTKVVYF